VQFKPVAVPTHAHVLALATWLGLVVHAAASADAGTYGDYVLRQGGG
jgi:hypothetical protein